MENKREKKTMKKRKLIKKLREQRKEEKESLYVSPQARDQSKRDPLKRASN